jgi:peptide/nickel transport system substrate-binding protein
VYPELAAALPKISKDKLTYTIPLRQGVQFNDGTPFNAPAVVTTLRRMLTLPGSTRASNYGPIDSVTAPTPYTVVIHLSVPFTPLLADLATNDSVIMSPTQLAKLGTSFGTDPTCVGPFMFDHQDPGVDVTVIKSPYYYDKYAVHLDKIVFKPESGASGVAALEAGDIQVLDSVGSSNLAAVQESSSIRVIKGGGLGWAGILINLGNRNGVGSPYSPVGSPLASSSMLRQAFEEAIDRNAYVKVVGNGAAIPDCTPVSPLSPAYDKTVQCTPYDPGQAKALVAKSGIPSPTVHLLATNTVEAQFIQAEEAAVGINVVIDLTDSATLSAREFSGSFDAVTGGFTGTPDFDRNVFQFFATSGSRNYGGYSSPRLDLILANARKADTAKALQTLYHAAFQQLLQDRPAIFLDHGLTYAGVSNAVEGVGFYSDRQIRVDFAQYK